MDHLRNPWARTWPKGCFCPKLHICANTKILLILCGQQRCWTHIRIYDYTIRGECQCIRFFLFLKRGVSLITKENKKLSMAQLIMVKVTLFMYSFYFWPLTSQTMPTTSFDSDRSVCVCTYVYNFFFFPVVWYGIYICHCMQLDVFGGLKQIKLRSFNKILLTFFSKKN